LAISLSNIMAVIFLDFEPRQSAHDVADPEAHASSRDFQNRNLSFLYKALDASAFQTKELC